MNNRLLCCNDAPYSGRIYFTTNNKRKWIPSAVHMEAYQFNWDQVETVAADDVAKYDLTAPLPNPLVTYNEHMSCEEMRDFLANQLNGRGVEFGAASRPFPCPLQCQVEYADYFDHAAPSSPYYNNNSYTDEKVKATYITGIEDMKGIEESSLDFIIACHVIEHVRNPLLAIETAWNKLKPKGKLVLLVPHRDLTFDAGRDLTTLDHLILDYKRPLKERDFLHFVEFYEKAFVSSNPFEKAVSAFNSINSDIHYHTWNEESFLTMIQYFSNHIKKWSGIVYYPHLKQQGANEFYFLLEK